MNFFTGIKIVATHFRMQNAQYFICLTHSERYAQIIFQRLTEYLEEGTAEPTRPNWKQYSKLSRNSIQRLGPPKTSSKQGQSCV